MRLWHAATFFHSRGAFQPPQQQVLALPGVDLPEDRLHEGLAPGMDLLPDLGLQRPGHSLTGGGIGRNPAPRRCEDRVPCFMRAAEMENPVPGSAFRSRAISRFAFEQYPVSTSHFRGISPGFSRFFQPWDPIPGSRWLPGSSPRRRWPGHCSSMSPAPKRPSAARRRRGTHTPNTRWPRGVPVDSPAFYGFFESPFPNAAPCTEWAFSSGRRGFVPGPSEEGPGNGGAGVGPQDLRGPKPASPLPPCGRY